MVTLPTALTAEVFQENELLSSVIFPAPPAMLVVVTAFVIPRVMPKLDPPPATPERMILPPPVVLMPPPRPVT